MKTINIDELDARYPPKDPVAYRKAYEEAVLSFDIAEITYTLRTQAGLTQKQLAEQLGTSQPAIARMESGGHKPNVAMIERLAQALGVRIRLVAEPINESATRRPNLTPASLAAA
jgi:transcriptional regulator with XRE-family HTH domain